MAGEWRVRPDGRLCSYAAALATFRERWPGTLEEEFQDYQKHTSEAHGLDPAVDCVIPNLPNLTPERLRSFAQAMEDAEGAGTQEARMALLIQAFREASHAHGTPS